MSSSSHPARETADAPPQSYRCLQTPTGQAADTGFRTGQTTPASADGLTEAAFNRASAALDEARRAAALAACDETPAQSARQTVEDIGAVIARDRVCLVLQPVVRSLTGETAFYEGLMRFGADNGALRSAGGSIQQAERHGHSCLVDRTALDLAADLLRRAPGLHLSLNVSGLTCGDARWLGQLEALAATAPDIVQRLIIEITETAAIEDAEQSVIFVDRVKAAGSRVAIDDFGAGHTSFDMLRQLAVDIIKIDGTFVKNIGRSERDRVFLGSMVELATVLGMETVAEWVVDAEVAALAAATGVTYMQGFHFGRPLTADAILGSDDARPLQAAR